MNPTDIAQGTAIGRTYAYYIVAGTRVPHPRHYPNLAALAGVELPTTFSAALSMAAISEKSGRSANSTRTSG
jgi:hypothetical protein